MELLVAVSNQLFSIDAYALRYQIFPVQVRAECQFFALLYLFLVVIDVVSQSEQQSHYWPVEIVVGWTDKVSGFQPRRFADPQ